MNKTQLIEKIAADAGINKVQAQKAIQSFQDAVIETVKQNQSLDLLGFGKFMPKVFKARLGYNIKTKEKQQLPECKSVQFKVGLALKKAIADA